mmetsp:Transcript_134073/g.303995  ORF Transcript_134073/g.303995 Transcript_134073/m.303995 type:complete len:176 (-) Transcript_134073:26-553(-)
MLKGVLCFAALVGAATLRGGNSTVEGTGEMGSVGYCQALREMRCEMERLANSTNSSGLMDVSGQGQLLAEKSVMDTWQGKYSSHVAYIRDCFAYSVSASNLVPDRKARIKVNYKVTKEYFVKRGEEKDGICLAIEYIGTMEGKSTTKCHKHPYFRQTSCPERCPETDSMVGCRNR